MVSFIINSLTALFWLCEFLRLSELCVYSTEYRRPKTNLNEPDMYMVKLVGCVIHYGC